MRTFREIFSFKGSRGKDLLLHLASIALCGILCGIIAFFLGVIAHYGR